VYYAITGVVILSLSTLFSVIFVKRHTTEQSKEVKAVLFGLYFWGLVFLQLIICAVAYTLIQKNDL
jgi:hypothetical protein